VKLHNIVSKLKVYVSFSCRILLILKQKLKKTRSIQNILLFVPNFLLFVPTLSPFFYNLISIIFFNIFILSVVSTTIIPYREPPRPQGYRASYRRLIVYAILILTGVSTSPLLYSAFKHTTLLFLSIFNAPLISAFSLYPNLFNFFI
jgi:hypothetical protein